MKIIKELNDTSVQNRLYALKNLISSTPIKMTFHNFDINNHVHTFYSFSPYSPTHAAYCAYVAGLGVAGIVDHDTVSGIKEFHKATKILGIASTGGVEVRVKLPAFHDRTINNPDQKGVMYVVAHGITTSVIDDFDEYLKPYREHREIRNKKMTQKINLLLSSINLHLDYENDVRSISKVTEGGSVTERHILMALSQLLLKHFTDVNELIDFIENTFEVNVSPKQEKLISDPNNELIAYDLLGVLKTNTSKYYIPATDELPNAQTFVAFAKAHGAIPAYAYLGDIEVSITGDKRSQKFEDDYLEELFIEIKRIGIPAIAYMPTRNSKAQIERLQSLAKQYQMIEISGEDINSPRQSFNCDAYKNPQNQHLIDSAWALVGHERLVIDNPDNGILGDAYKDLSIKERIKYLSTYARKMRQENE